MKKPLGSLLKLTALGFAAGAFLSAAQAQVSLSGTSYSENFDNLASGLPAGWTVRTGANASSLGNAITSALATKDWAGTSGSFGNYASTTNYDGTVYVGTESAATQALSSNRALGVRQTGSFGDPGAAFVFQIENTLGLGNFQMGFDLDLLSPQGRSTTWTIDYAIGNTPTSFTPLGTYVTGSTNAGAVFGTTRKTFSFGTALDNQSENIWIRVVALSAAPGSGSRPTTGIDNFQLTFNTVNTGPTAPSITTQPINTTNAAGSTASFTVAVSGTAPFSYQWKKGGVDLTDGVTASGSIVAGANSPTLYITNVFAPDAGNYTVSVQNSVNGTTSSGATLTVLDPAIVFQPTDRVNLVGDTAVFAVTANGTDLQYQWRFNGDDIAGATSSMLGVPNAQSTNQGNYSVRVYNSYTSVISSNATLTLYPRPSVRIAQWDFNSNPLDGNATTGENIPSVGSGTISLVGGVTRTYAAGSFADPVALVGDNTAFNTSTYAAQGQENKTRGIEVRTSTEGYKNIFLSWEQRNSNTASKYTRLQYSTNGVDFVDFNVIEMTSTNNSFVLITNDLSSLPSVNDNPNFAFRVVTEIEGTAIGNESTNYLATVSGNTYGNSGTIRYEYLNIYGEPLGAATPIPLVVQSVGGNVTLSWSDASFVLQSATTVSGPYTDVDGATSPYAVSTTGLQKFYRLYHP